MGKLTRLVALLCLMLLFSFSSAIAKPLKMAVVVKVGGIPWFNAMEVGVVNEGKKLGIDAFVVGPTSADPAMQVRAIEDLIAQGVDIIGVVPNDATVLEPVLKKARDRGIVIITHESPDQKYADWNFELVDAKALGEAHMKLMAELLGGEGKYAIYVGSLTVPLHNEWADYATKYQKEHYPKMSMVGERFGVGESIDDSIRTTNDLMSAHPDLKGVIGFGSQAPIGAAQAVQRRGKTGEVKVIGIFSPGQGKRLVERGVIQGGYMWNPMLAGEVFVKIGKHVKEGGTYKDGDTIEGLGEIDVQDINIFGEKVESLDIDNIGRLADIGL